MDWNFMQDAVLHYAARRRLQSLQLLHGLKDRHMDMLLAMAACLDPAAGELSLSMTVRDLGRRAGLTQTQAKRVLAELHDRGFIVRHQPEKIAGCEAITTLLPLAFEALGYDLNLPEGQVRVELPLVLRQALCGQPAQVVVEVCAAWEEGRVVEASARAQFRGAWPDLIDQLLAGRQHALQEPDIEAEGVQVLETLAGPVAVDGLAFEQLVPGNVPWEFVREVMEEVAWRDPARLTPETLPTLIAEAAYSRQHAPFCRDLPWREAVWRLGGVMARSTWARPRRIRPDWYAAAQRACGSLLARKRAFA